MTKRVWFEQVDETWKPGYPSYYYPGEPIDNSEPRVIVLSDTLDLSEVPF